MKQITNANELKEGQKYLIELEYRYDNTETTTSFRRDFKYKEDNILSLDDNFYESFSGVKLPIYEKTEVKAIDTPCLDEIIGNWEKEKLNIGLSAYGEKLLTELY